MSEHEAEPGRGEDPSSGCAEAPECSAAPRASRRRRLLLRGAAVLGVNLLLVGAVALSAHPPLGLGEDEPLAAPGRFPADESSFELSLAAHLRSSTTLL